MNSRIDAAVAKLEAKGLSPDPLRRRSSLLSRQGTLSLSRQSTLSRAVSTNPNALTRAGSVNPNPPRPAETPSGPKLQRLYTIDQDAFFPDLPQLVQVRHFLLSVTPCCLPLDHICFILLRR